MLLANFSPWTPGSEWSCTRGGLQVGTGVGLQHQSPNKAVQPHGVSRGAIASRSRVQESSCLEPGGRDLPLLLSLRPKLSSSFPGSRAICEKLKPSQVGRGGVALTLNSLNRFAFTPSLKHAFLLEV